MIGIITNGVTGRMGYHQHLVNAILPIRDEGGVLLPDGSREQVEPILLGRDERKLREIAQRHGVEHFSTDFDGVLGDSRWQVYADFATTDRRAASVRKALAAEKHVYTEKPSAGTFGEAQELAEQARLAGVKTGVVHDKLYLPGFRKLAGLITSGFFGRIISVRGEFGYWVFEGDWRRAQRPSWNYRAERGGGLIVDMFPHWNYILEYLFGPVRSVYAHSETGVDTRFDEQGDRYAATAEDAVYAILGLEGGVTAQLNTSWTTRIAKRELMELQVDGTHGSAVAGLIGCRIQPRDATPAVAWQPDRSEPADYSHTWLDVPADGPFINPFKAQWCDFLRSVAGAGAYEYDFDSGARDMLLAECAVRSAATGTKVDVSRGSIAPEAVPR